MSKIEIAENGKAEILYVHGASVSTLVPFLRPQIPWVWILGHMPDEHMQWWRTSLPVNKQNVPISAEFRLVCYDLMLPTAHFLEMVSAFDNHGILLVQSNRRMPDTLDLLRIPEARQSEVLRSNGAFLRINLPHAVETAQIQCFEKGYLANVIAANKSF